MTPPELESEMTAFTSLSSTLWRVREVLDQLLYRVFVTQLVLRSDEPKWLANASRELDGALQELRHIEVLRAVEIVAIADQLGLPADMTLAQLARSAPSPWDTILLEHRDALRILTADMQHATSDPSRPAAGEEPARPEPGAALDTDVDIVRTFLVETLANAPQASLTAFLT
jgi:hypothetical protein